ncbi:hypothetical protein [Roseibium album]|nr:hypothetical protein [Labrenzia sp. EL_195]
MPKINVCFAPDTLTKSAISTDRFEPNIDGDIESRVIAPPQFRWKN